MKELPIGIQTLSSIIEDEKVYVDKTEIAYKLVGGGRGRYFLSRPRRFGKSLFLDTLRQIFEGNKELFKGLFIYDKWDWDRKFPVILLDLSTVSGRTVEELEDGISYEMMKIAKRNDIELSGRRAVQLFDELITALKEREKEGVIILVDEYDKPLLDNIEDSENAQKVRDYLREFYGVIKKLDEYIYFVFITGVSKFSKVSIFSGINNLEDISLNSDYATICGYTHKDLETYFGEHLEGVDLEEVKRWYNGYNFLGERVYNPFDILLFIKNHKTFDNYWFETGTPTFLVKFLKKKKYYVPNLEAIEVDKEEISSLDMETMNLTTVLYQTGYLTIKEEKVKYGNKVYELTYPNKEVRYSLNNYLFNDNFKKEVTKKNIMENFNNSMEELGKK